MKITAITATYQRTEAFALCQRYMEAQTRQPNQWLVLAGPEPMPQKVLSAIEEGQVKGDAIVFFEDDDFYAPTWIEWCATQLEKFDLVGEGLAVYYNVRRRWWSECRNVRHASLAQTAITRELFEPLCNIIRGFDSPFFDTRLWQLDCSKFLALPGIAHERRVVGIKGMPGTTGYSAEHRQDHPPGVHADPSLLQLWKLIGPAAASYAKFKS